MEPTNVILGFVSLLIVNEHKNRNYSAKENNFINVQNKQEINIFKIESL